LLIIFLRAAKHETEFLSSVCGEKLDAPFEKCEQEAGVRFVEGLREGVGFYNLAGKLGD